VLGLLKRSSADTITLITVYITVLWPILEYACEVWHSNIENVLRNGIERIEKHALRWLPTVLGLCRGNLSTREISSATRNTRGRRCKRGGFF
jgi:hypothetical protein